jgi:cellulose synthase/poly-beta-1,6-N-acetylglucosamine synthase-like glycosyltransferase
VIRASIIIPALNEAENLARHLPIIKSQLDPADELIVVDNGSSDETARIAERLGARVVAEPVRGRSRARNKGIELARGELLVFLDADCRPSPGWLPLLLEPFADPKIGCVAGEIRILFSQNRLGGYLSSKGHLSQQVNFNHSFLPYAGSGNVAFRRAVLERIGGFDEAMYSGHDADICWRMQLQTPFRIVLVADAVVDHHQSLTVAALARQKRRHAYGAVLLYKKYRDRRVHENRTLKRVYWEYRSILRRGAKFLANRAAARLGFVRQPPAEQGYQLLLEISERIGRLEGSIALRVWYP